VCFLIYLLSSAFLSPHLSTSALFGPIFFLNVPLSPISSLWVLNWANLLDSVSSSLILSSCQDISGQILSLGKSCFPLGLVAHYNEINLKNLYVIPPGRSPITMRLFLKSLRIFHHSKNLCIFFTCTGRLLQSNHFEKSLHFSPRSVANYNETTLENICIFPLGQLPITIKPIQQIKFLS
jgi:hypothetical protein